MFFGVVVPTLRINPTMAHQTTLRKSLAMISINAFVFFTLMSMYVECLRNAAFLSCARPRVWSQSTLCFARTVGNDDHDDDDDDYYDDDLDGIGATKTEYNGIPQLPPIGSSSISPDFSASANATPQPFVANHKFQLQYTCKICETRNFHSVSRIAYRQGVVIARCKGCDSQHLIADHLGWTDYDGGFQGNKTNTIEDYFSEDPEVKVNRVSTEVYELEKILQSYSTKSGAIVGDDGKLAME